MQWRMIGARNQKQIMTVRVMMTRHSRQLATSWPALTARGLNSLLSGDSGGSFVMGKTGLFILRSYMWQANLEIKTIGWPVVPLTAFSNADAYTTSTRCS